MMGLLMGRDPFWNSEQAKRRMRRIQPRLGRTPNRWQQAAEEQGYTSETGGLRGQEDDE